MTPSASSAKFLLWLKFVFFKKFSATFLHSRSWLCKCKSFFDLWITGSRYQYILKFVSNRLGIEYEATEAKTSLVAN